MYLVLIRRALHCSDGGCSGQKFKVCAHPLHHYDMYIQFLVQAVAPTPHEIRVYEVKFSAKFRSAEDREVLVALIRLLRETCVKFRYICNWTNILRLKIQTRDPPESLLPVLHGTMLIKIPKINKICVYIMLYDIYITLYILIRTHTEYNLEFKYNFLKRDCAEKLPDKSVPWIHRYSDGAIVPLFVQALYPLNSDFVAIGDGEASTRSSSLGR